MKVKQTQQNSTELFFVTPHYWLDLYLYSNARIMESDRRGFDDKQLYDVHRERQVEDRCSARGCVSVANEREWPTLIFIFIIRIRELPYQWRIRI